ncbi:MAG TPA: nuclear transport factor 2 family protein [Acidobacteriaceae bacterium]|jgi:ketosteroid isomerase-like protein|nr:nuclear transport factor 2 family protein [Acidobacteriaceae bacterium]
MSRRALTFAALCLLGRASLGLHAQLQSIPQQPPAPPAGQHHLEPFKNSSIPPGALELVRLETEFQKAVEKGGGKAFASWFADDGVTLNNGHPAVLGQQAIAADATWDSKNYQLTWYAEGGQMGPSGDTGFTWGHYDAHGRDNSGKPTSSSGRYITFWKKVNGAWKVALDASANEPSSPLP